MQSLGKTKEAFNGGFANVVFCFLKYEFRYCLSMSRVYISQTRFYKNEFPELGEQFVCIHFRG